MFGEDPDESDDVVCLRVSVLQLSVSICYYYLMFCTIYMPYYWLYSCLWSISLLPVLDLEMMLSMLII